ncbi:hypothetical protein [Desulfovibrio sp. JC010]|uniref:hypothetical protein n=1 Tax=Desulfovibrio sp. JC010 TaxID=2593641 RepID=UPI0013D04832|nr:hypothetical protein [Desulfovibrio sp. JC010]
MNNVAVRGGFKLTKGNARKLTVATFEKWLSVAEKHHLPTTRAINTFCAVVNDMSPLLAQLQVHDAQIMTREQAVKCELGDLYLASKETRKRMRELEGQL